MREQPREKTKKKYTVNFTHNYPALQSSPANTHPADQTSMLVV